LRWSGGADQDYLEDRLSTVDRRRLEEHLATCEACGIYIEQFRHTIRALGRLPEESLSSETRNTLLAGFQRLVSPLTAKADRPRPVPLL
jgi:anti-sigma factor RsiW